MIETQESICQWAAATLGPAASPARILARANEELAECIRAITAGAEPAKIVEEAADTAIVLCRAAERVHLGLDRFDLTLPWDPDWDEPPLHLAARAGKELMRALRLADHPADFAVRSSVRSAFLLLAELAHRLGFSLWGQIDCKMAVNRGRVWRRDGTGHGYHVRDKSLVE